ncbi:hypothetical protein BH11BAC7_BH11BAC7_36180 [soil metagenome]
MKIIYRTLSTMRPLLIFAILLFSLSLAAKKAPKWKPGVFKTTSDGIRYSIKKQGSGKEIKKGDVVRFMLFVYDFHTKKYDAVLSPGKNASNSKTGGVISLDENSSGNGIIKAIELLKKGGEGFFIIPGRLVGAVDSSCCFIRIIEVTTKLEIYNPPKDSLNTDSVKFAVSDPNKKYFGDTLIALMKLVEQPQMVNCGISKVMIAFKFETTYFENGMQHKNILVFVECPEFYGTDYFIAGRNYMVTCIPLLDDLKDGKRTMNSYSLEKLDRYYGLRVRRM